MGKVLQQGTRVVRAARALPPGEGQPVALPLVQSVAFDYRSAAKQDEVFGNERAGYVYGRYGSPTTSNTSENYYTYWGRIWDEAHPAAGH